MPLGRFIRLLTLNAEEIVKKTTRDRERKRRALGRDYSHRFCGSVYGIVDIFVYRMMQAL